MTCRLVLWILCGALALATSTNGADAVEIKCIEASKYKYLYQIFDNDPKKFAAYLQVDPAKLPSGEICRAVLITGRINSTKQSKDAGEASDGDKLLAAISQGGGWLSTVYLVSGGGSIGMGLALAQTTRMFWLKVRSPSAKSFTYQPDFFHPGTAPPSSPPEVPPEFASGWAAYTRAVAPFQPVSLASGNGRCASACTFLHAAGIDRLGTAHVHRGRPGRVRDSSGKMVEVPDRSMSDSLEGLHRAEATVLALYRHMDSGDDFIRLFQATPTATVTAATTDRFPRYLLDALHGRCRPRQQRGAAAAPTGPAQEEQCVAAAQEKERLSQFAKYCAKGCDRKAIVTAIRAKIKELTPPKADAPRPAR